MNIYEEIKLLVVDSVPYKHLPIVTALRQIGLISIAASFSVTVQFTNGINLLFTRHRLASGYLHEKHLIDVAA